MKKRKKQIAFVFGTRPEVIKLAPLILLLKKNKKFQSILVSVGQHDILLRDALDAFNLRADVNLAIMHHSQSLASILTNAVNRLDGLFAKSPPSMTIVLGDTSSTLAASIVSFYHHVPVAHVEAGCRTDNIYEPFPEEVNRRLIASIATWHFPATRTNFKNLLHEGYNKKDIFLVGSTEADAVDWILKNTPSASVEKIIPEIDTMKHLVVVTTHRRENWGAPLKEVFATLQVLAKSYPQVQFVHAVHPNPLISHTAENMLSGLANFKVVPHIPTASFVHLAKQASLLMTDSGGVQLQAGYLRKPVIILRNVTEWPELVERGIGQLAGTKKHAIIHAFEEYVSKAWPRKTPVKPLYPTGASKKIAKIISSL